MFWRNVLLSPNLLNSAVMLENRACDKSLLAKYNTWGNQRDRTLCFKYRRKVKRTGPNSSTTHICQYIPVLKGARKLFTCQMKSIHPAQSQLLYPVIGIC